MAQSRDVRNNRCREIAMFSWPSVEILAEDAADALLGNRNHLLHLLLPDKNRHGYDLRHRRHTAFLHLTTTSEISLTGSCTKTVTSYIYISFIVELRSVSSY